MVVSIGSKSAQEGEGRALPLTGMATACAFSQTVPVAGIPTRSTFSPTKLKSYLIPALGLAKVSFSVNKSLGGSVKATGRSKGRAGVGTAGRVKMAASTEISSTSEAESRPFGVLFVCLGNICRSPSAEAVFRDVVEKRKLDSQFNIDSAGTIGYHEGSPADPRMKAAALKRGVKLTSISRPIRPSDFEEFDLILAMDKSNKADILTAYDSWNRRGTLPAGAKEKVKLMCSYCTKHDVDEVPDPYYGGPAGFEKVLDLLDDACVGLLNSIQELQAQDKKVNVKTST